MADPLTDPELELMRHWVETWRRAGKELEEIRRREIGEMDTREAIRQLFGSVVSFRNFPAPPTSGLVEQQRWFAKLRR